MNYLTQSYHYPGTTNQNSRSTKKYQTINSMEYVGYQSPKFHKTLRWNIEENAKSFKKEDFTSSSINAYHNQASTYQEKENKYDSYLHKLKKNTNGSKSMKAINYDFPQNQTAFPQKDYMTSTMKDFKPSTYKSSKNIQLSALSQFDYNIKSPKQEYVSKKQLLHSQKSMNKSRSQKQIKIPFQQSYKTTIEKKQYILQKESNPINMTKKIDKSYKNYERFEQPKTPLTKSSKHITTDLTPTRLEKKNYTFNHLQNTIGYPFQNNNEQFDNKYQKSQKSKDLSRNAKRGKISLNDFQIGKCKGEGAFGKVFIAIHKATKMLVAIKQIPKQKIKYMIDQFITQIKIQMFLDHPNIVKLYGFFDDQTSFYIIMEYMQGGNIWTIIKHKKKLNEAQTVQKLKQVCLGIKQMHDNNILHRDIKPQNIVLTNDVCKICDFGWAAVCTDRRTTYCGTLDYISPEIINGEGYDDSVDVWCIGVLAYQMLCGKTPFYNINRKQTMKKIINVNYQYPTQISTNAKKFIDKILKKDPNQRLDINQVLKHQLLSK